jgi:hypothetical protein
MKTAQIKIKLKSDTGLNSETNTTITVDQWRDINMVIEGKLSSEKWVKVEDDFPDNGLIVDIFHPEKGRICNVSIVDDQFIQEADCKTNAPCWRKLPTLWTGITHWMPLPTTPEQ